MTILLTGGGSGGHIIPLLAVARELKLIDPTLRIVGVCETGAAFAHLYKDDPTIDEVRQVSAGKYRRYAGLSRLQRLVDVPTFAHNTRDIGRVVKGYAQARKLLRELRPDIILIKGGFVGVPVGLAAARLGIPFITHDSDSIPGLANRIIAKWARKHATGMPAHFYTYPPAKTVYTGVPIAQEFTFVTPAMQAQYREELGLGTCQHVITIIGASQGAQQLNQDSLSIVGRLMQRHKNLGIVHIAGPAHEEAVKRAYASELLADERQRVIVKGFVGDVYRHIGAADVVISRAGATGVAELAVQAKASIIVPGLLAGDHQTMNARHLAEAHAVLFVANDDREGLYEAVNKLLTDDGARGELAAHIHKLAQPHAAHNLATILLDEVRVTALHAV